MVIALLRSESINPTMWPTAQARDESGDNSGVGFRENLSAIEDMS
jgi:hypothetical protein